MRIRVPFRLVSLAALSLLLLGCAQIQVSESFQSTAITEDTSVGRPGHDLSVLGVEIDPPLEDAIRAADGSISFQLLVAVENRGVQPERDVIVEAWLRSPDVNGGVALLSGRTIVPYIAPGQVEVARLRASGVIPVRLSYVLVVSVRPVPFETYLGNNTSQYEVSVSLQQS